MTLETLLLFVLVVPSSVGRLPDAAPAIRGHVVDGDGHPLEGVLVSVGHPPHRSVTDAHGDFTIEPAAGSVCPCDLTAALPGYQSGDVSVSPATPVVVVLQAVRPTFRAAVTGSSAAADPSAASRVSISPLDVVRTAGTQADLMRELSTLPGVSTIDGGTGLFVRGGDTSEVSVLFDGVVMNHPYRNETPTGGFRGSVDPFLTKDTTFTTGGFASPYGDALSAIVDLTPQDRPVAPEWTATAGFAGVSFSAARPVGANNGFRVAANRATPSVLFSVNRSGVPFDRYPGGWDLSGAWYTSTRGFGDLRVFVLGQTDHVGVQIQRDAFTGFLHSATSHQFLAAHWQQQFSGGWTLSASGGTDRYRSIEDAGVLQLNDLDANHSGRADLTGHVGAWSVHTGVTTDRDDPDTGGTVPVVGGDFAGIAGVKTFAVSNGTWATGAFVDGIRAFGRLTSEIGARVDYFQNAQAWTADPRLALVETLTANTRLRLAVGRYHQAPPPEYFDRNGGTPSLAPMEATHVIVGYEYGSPTGPSSFRVEAYDKIYRHLPLQNGAGFDSTGYGRARGVDVFVSRTWARATLRANASGLDAARRWTPWNEENTYPIPASGPWAPDFDIPWSSELVSTIKAPKGISIALAWRTAAGTPATPAAGAVLTPDGYEPIWGPINSERLPAYDRADASIDRSIHGGHRSAIVFVSVDNALNHRNVSSYVYSTDYTTRTTVPSGSPRSVYLGVTIR